MRSFVIWIVFALSVFCASAQTFVSGNLEYSVSDADARTVDVTRWLANKQLMSSDENGTVTVPESVAYNGEEYAVTKIGTGAFSNHDDLRVVTLPNSILRIEDGNFYRCASLEKVVLSESLNHIGLSSFQEADNLKSIVLPNSLDRLSGCMNHVGLEELTLPNSITSLWWTLCACPNLRKLTLNTITSCSMLGTQNIRELVFTENAALVEGVLPRFENLEKIVFSKGCISSGDIVAGSMNLREVVCEDDFPPFGECPLAWAARDLGEKVVVWVPEGAYETYAKDSEWGRFTIKEMTEDYAGVRNVGQDVSGAVEVWTLDGVFRGRFGSLNEVRCTLNGGAYLIRENGKGRIVKI